jgi:hypothetical protein
MAKVPPLACGNQAEFVSYGPESVSIRKNILMAFAGTKTDVVPSPAEAVAAPYL